jgi:hypothetical protein
MAGNADYFTPILPFRWPTNRSFAGKPLNNAARNRDGQVLPAGRKSGSQLRLGYQ